MGADFVGLTGLRLWEPVYAIQRVVHMAFEMIDENFRVKHVGICFLSGEKNLKITPKSLHMIGIRG